MKTNLGKVAITPKGVWNATTEYKRLDAVSNGGASWLAMQDNTGVTPVEGEDWMVLTQNQIDDGVVELDTSWSSKHTVDMLCPEITATGNPVVLEDCVEGYPMDVAASWDIQQEGEGTPHIAGCGANLLDITKCSTPSQPSYGLTTSIIGDTVVMTGMVSGIGKKSYMSVVFTPDYTLSGKGYVITAFPIKGTIPMIYGLRTETEKAIAIQLPSYADGETVDLQFRIMVSASTPTEYEIYGDNIRPFVGRDSVMMRRCGKNLFYTCNGEVTISNRILNGYNASIPAPWNDTRYAYPVSQLGKAGDKFVYQAYIDNTNGSASNDVNIWYFNADGKIKAISSKQRQAVAQGSKGISYSAFIIPEEAVYICPGLYIQATGTDCKATISNFMLCKVDTFAEQEYVPCECVETTMTLPETVYGGLVDNKGNGQITWKIANVEGLTNKWVTWGASSPGGGYWGFFTYALNGVNAQNIAFVNSRNANEKFTHCEHGFAYTDRKTCASFVRTGIAPSFSCYFAMSLPASELEDVSTTDAACASFKKWLAAQTAAGTPVQMTYPVITPNTFATTPATIPALPTSTVITDADTLTVTARKDPIKTITNLTDRISALEAAATNISEV